jgi:hypothetical protein
MIQCLAWLPEPLARGFGEFLDGALEPGGAHRRRGYITGHHAGKVALITAEPLEPHQIENFRAVEQPLEACLKSAHGHRGCSPYLFRSKP